MKAFRNFVLTIIITSILTLTCLTIASKIFTPKWINHDMNMMTFIVKGFYKEPKNSLDVIFLGNSDTYRGVDPLVIYHEYGFTSYNFVSAGQRMWTGYAMFEEALRKQNPKVIMFNVDGVFSTNQSSSGNYSKVYDNMPFSLYKVKYIFDKNYKKKRKIERLSHLMPIFSYHDRYNELTSDDFKYAFYDEHYALKGMDMVAYRVPYKGTLDYMKDIGKREEVPEINQIYLDKMLNECKKRNIEFVLFHTPSSESANYSRYLAVKDYADKNNLTFLELNFNNKEIGINWAEDTSDGGDHLNMFGAQKVGLYLGKYLKENYDLPDHRTNQAFSKWNDDYKEYLDLREKEIKDAKELGKY